MESLRGVSGLTSTALLQSGMPYIANDLPCGGKRLPQKASGYRRTMVAGVTTNLDSEPTGALPGKLVRSGSLNAAMA